jgi:hypothetical protein
LTDARLATADGKRDYSRSGTTYTPQADVDPDTFEPSLVSGSKVIVSGSDEFGNRTLFQVEATATGTKLTQMTQTADAGGNSSVTTKSADFDLEGKLKQATQSTKMGTLTQDDVSAEATVEAAPEGSESSTQPCVPGGVGERACEQTQQQILTALTAKPEADKPTDPTARSTSELLGVMPSLGLSGWSMPAHTGECPTLV